MKKNILVIGGAGYIGSQVNKMLNQKGYNTIVFDNLSSGFEKTVTNSRFIKGDIKDKNALDTLFKSYKIDAVMHFAALIQVGESVIDPLKYYEHNVSYTLNILNSMKEHGVKNFIFSSSAAVYGIPSEQSETIDETHHCCPINPYGTSKLMVEKILTDCAAAYGIKYISLRYFNAAGGDPDGVIKNYQISKQNLIPIIFNTLTHHGVVKINGNDYPTKDGTCIRDYIHIFDLGNAHILAMEKLLSGGSSSIYNLGNGSGFSVKEVIDAVQAVTGINIKTEIGPRRPGDPPILVANADKAKTELGWKPIYPNLEDMISHAWKAYEAKT